MIIFFLAHYNSCIFYKVALLENNQSINWMINLDIQNTDWFTKYINGLYFSFITMVTVGYGDVLPVTTGEKIYMICFVLVSCMTFAYVVNTVGNLFSEYEKREYEYQKKKFDIIRYLKEKNISKPL